jgi:uroporphyrinogen-III synthase
MRVALTREDGKNNSLLWLVPEGAETIEVPLTQTRYFSPSEVDAQLDRIHESKTIAISSARAAQFIAPVIEKFGDLPIYCVGESTAGALHEVGASARWVGSGGARELAQQIPEGPVLFVGAKDAREELGVELSQRGIELQMVACYETIPVELSARSIEWLRGADVIFIGAPSAWAVARPFVRRETLIVTSGTTTGSMVRETHDTVIEMRTDVKALAEHDDDRVRKGR